MQLLTRSVLQRMEKLDRSGADLRTDRQAGSCFFFPSFFFLDHEPT